ncbi:MAG TPA: carbon monoxide dehydrogenase [Acidimicrobiia bacterium]|jgi:carbon monoxide dehydrogenase subunit G|nr:carbon monoxide dehydrogenase [Acidimicrobiia bacterium]HIL46383.1 carbon monoxide dehydrogenase [Acidimicrobiia bacterium]
MELINDFEVDAPAALVWSILTDVERIAPCLPGAQLQEIEGTEFRGAVKIKVGPITAQYKGAASFVEQDDENYRAVLHAEGRDTRGAGNAAANIIAQLKTTETGTRVTVTTELKVTGKVAQFGRGIMADVSKKLMKQFADNLSELIAASDAEPAAPVAEESGEETPNEKPEVKIIESEEVEAVNLLDAVGAPVIKRLLPVLAVAAVVVLLIIIF